MSITGEELAEILKNPDLRIDKAVLVHGERPSINVQPSKRGGKYNESAWQSDLIKLLHHHGWKVCEFRKARVMRGGTDVYRTPFGADGVGFPDLVAVRPPRVLFIENKSSQGNASPEQVEWLMTLGKCSGVETYCWRTSELEKIESILE